MNGFLNTMVWPSRSEIGYLIGYTFFCAISYALIQALEFYIRKSRTPDDPSQELSDLEMAYLVGGASRVNEIAFTLLLRDSWLRPEEGGGFSAAQRHDGPPAPELLAELLTEISKHDRFDISQLSGIHLVETDKIAQSLVARDYSLVKEDQVLSARFFLFPVIMMVAGFAYRVAKYPADFQVNTTLFFVFLATLMTLMRARPRHPVATLNGLGRIQDLKTRIIERRKSQAFNSTYDPLWEAKDDVLFHGLRANGGLIRPVAAPTRESAS